MATYRTTEEAKAAALKAQTAKQAAEGRTFSAAALKMLLG